MQVTYLTTLHSKVLQGNMLGELVSSFHISQRKTTTQ